MIPYHGTPLGGKDCEKPAFLMGRHALVSFAHPRDIEVVAECCQSFVLDNGAFSAWKRGEPISEWKPYYEFCREWFAHPGCDWGIIPDVIDCSEADNDMQIAKAGFALDMNALRACDACVLVLPSGRSASWEFGWALGNGKKGAVVMFEKCEPELMYLGNPILTTPGELFDWAGFDSAVGQAT